MKIRVLDDYIINMETYEIEIIATKQKIIGTKELIDTLSHNYWNERYHNKVEYFHTISYQNKIKDNDTFEIIFADNLSNPESMTEKKELTQIIDTMYETLNEKQKYYADCIRYDIPTRDIVEKQKVARQVVHQNKKTALRKLKNYMEKHHLELEDYLR